uniref:DNA polymerase delta subunit 3 n=1 Tax=Cyclopterus lumpus TaxID=8103 RepID=A0A8C3G620_CYCLU
MDELYLDNIDEYVNDQDKIVTYKWLSLTLGVHVNTAKQMLFHYLDHKRKESSAQLNATYLVSGKFVDNGQTCHKVSVVKEDKLEDFKSKMSLIVSVHVYSVQKALLKDSGPLYSVDYDAVKDNMKNCSRYSAIRCASAVPVCSPELQQTREIQQSPTPEPENKKPGMNGEANLASKPSTKPQRGIMGMFANKSAPKNQDGGKDVKPEQKEDAPVVWRCSLLFIPDSPQRMETREPSWSPKKKVESVSHSHQGNSEMKTRKRRRVLKSRTFLDDEGCIVTEKGYESESYSEAEDDVQAAKRAPRNPVAAKLSSSTKPDEKRSHKKTSANANKGTKQASIMGFFQKK